MLDIFHKIPLRFGLEIDIKRKWIYIWGAVLLFIPDFFYIHNSFLDIHNSFLDIQ